MAVFGEAEVVLAGGTMESDCGGDFSRGGGGVEARYCTRRGGGCVFRGAAARCDDHARSFTRSVTIDSRTDEAGGLPRVVILASTVVIDLCCHEEHDAEKRDQVATSRYHG